MGDPVSAANTGHSALDAQAGIRGELRDQPDDEREGRKLRSGVDFCRAQLEILEKQADDVEAKADEVTDMWNQKADEARRMADEKAQELADLEEQLSERTGF